MGFFGELTGGDAARRLEEAFINGDNLLRNGHADAAGNINRGLREGNRALNQAAVTNRQTNREVVGELTGARDNALAYLDPYAQGGQRANTMYENALGVNGLDAQRQFGQNYATYDPFRAQNAGFATEALMAALNARGLSGSGYAAQAVADQNLRRGSEDYNNYLNRLQGQGQQGFQAANQMAGVQQNYGNQRINQAGNFNQVNSNLAGQKSNNYTNQSNALADLNYGHAQQLVNLHNNYANGQNQARAQGMNNLMGLAGTALKFATGPINPTSIAGRIMG